MHGERIRIKLFLTYLLIDHSMAFEILNDYEFHLAHYMFKEKCKVRGVPPFIQFLNLVANTAWSCCNSPHLTARAT
jgi:hypothetical protein